MTQTFRFDPILPEGEVATLRRALEAAGWQETFDGDWDFYWDGSHLDTEFFEALKRDQWVNHFPGYAVFEDKALLQDNLSRRWADGGRFSGIHPRTFSMPGEYGAWRETAAAEPDQLWLVKPRRLSQGRGIALVRDPDKVPLGPKWIVQEYVQRPHLLDGYKYVLRFYLLVTSLDPLLCYLHGAGVCKRTSRPYTLDPDARGDSLIHLTNPSLHRRNKEVAWGALNGDHDTYRARLREDGIDDDRLFAAIRDVLAQTVIACREEALMRSRAVTRSLSNCFEFIGVDLIVDEDLRPWVLECNPSPSLGVGPGYDPHAARLVKGVKEAVIFDMVSLLGLSKPPCDAESTDRARYWRQRAESELSRAAGYERLWPAADADRYVPYFPLLRPLDEALAADACHRLSNVLPEIRASNRVAAFPLDEGLALFPEDQRRFYAVNAAGAALWLSIADGLQPAEVVGDLASAAPGADRERVEEGVWDLLVAWAQSGLLAGFERPEVAKAVADGSFTVSGTLRGSVLVVPLAHTDGEKMEQIELPAQDVRRLILVEPGQQSRTRLAIGHPAATLDALMVAAGDANRLDSVRAASLAAWLDGLEVFEIEVGVGGEYEATKLLDLVSDPSLIQTSEWA